VEQLIAFFSLSGDPFNLIPAGRIMFLGVWLLACQQHDVAFSPLENCRDPLLIENCWSF